MKLSKKQKVFFQFLPLVLKDTSNYDTFEKKDYPHSLCILGITDFEGRG